MTSLKIGPYTLPNQLILAPMAGITDLPFRELCLQMGAGMAVSEMISSNARLRNSKKSTLRTANNTKDLCSIQILGNDPNQMALAAQYNEKAGAHIIDINMGCPAKKVCNKAVGAALLKDELLVKEILQSVVASVCIPVTLKIRTGWDVKHKNGIQIAKIAEECGISAVAVHGRTRQDMYKGSAEYETVAEIKQSVSIPVLANGDISSPEKAAFILNETKVDGLLIGRAAQGRPWIFQEIDHFLRTGEKAIIPSLSEILSIIKRHICALHNFYGEVLGVRIARKHFNWYINNVFSDTKNIRLQFNSILHAHEQCKYLDNFLNYHQDQAS